MTSLKSAADNLSLAPTVKPGLRHPLCRGDFAAVVFSGRTDELDEWPGEPTSSALYKFGLKNPRLNARDDFARSAGRDLPQWPDDRVQPLDGVCFVFADADHPSLSSLLAAGGEESRHFIVLNSATASVGQEDLPPTLQRFVETLRHDEAVAVLGYGHQGAQICRNLVDGGYMRREQIVVHDSSDDSRRVASIDGFEVIEQDQVLNRARGVIYSPLMRHQRLHAILRRAERAGLAVLDNSSPSTGLIQFAKRENVYLDAVAEGALDVRNGALHLKPHGLPMCCQIIREDCRIIGGIDVPCLHARRAFSLVRESDVVDPADASAFESLHGLVRKGSERSYVTVRNRADHGFFAAREFCRRLWPAATDDVFLSEHFVDLGATSFERLLQGHVVGREIVSTMQTPSQRVTLGIVARHYACDRPIIEIGSAFGGSALLMATATDSDQPALYSIDPEASTRDIMRFAFQREGHLQRLHQLIKTSDKAIDDLQSLRGQAGLVFIDGLHTRHGVASDFENYADMIAPGGGLVFHDVCPQIHSVWQVVMDRVLHDGRFEIRGLVDGLAVFERR